MPLGDCRALSREGVLYELTLFWEFHIWEIFENVGSWYYFNLYHLSLHLIVKFIYFYNFFSSSSASA